MVTLGLALSLFLALSCLLCIAGCKLLANLPLQHSALAIFLPGFRLLTWRSFWMGLAQSVGWGWYGALLFGTIYNIRLSRRRGDWFPEAAAFSLRCGQCRRWAGTAAD
ncbi:hypothetical protein V475_20600 [Sphingobium baderi LL03]|nr:hypothetical protein V475_20600 [Sphingobium baderi LL03]